MKVPPHVVTVVSLSFFLSPFSGLEIARCFRTPILIDHPLTPQPHRSSPQHQVNAGICVSRAPVIVRRLSSHCDITNVPPACPHDATNPGLGWNISSLSVWISVVLPAMRRASSYERPDPGRVRRECDLRKSEDPRELSESLGVTTRVMGTFSAVYRRARLVGGYLSSFVSSYSAPQVGSVPRGLNQTIFCMVFVSHIVSMAHTWLGRNRLPGSALFFVLSARNSSPIFFSR